MKVLVIEDEKAQRKVLMDVISREGYEVFGASDGEEGLSLAKQNKPDIILLDIIIPILDGVEVLKGIRADAEIKDIPVIILTNITDMDRSKEAFELGAVDYLVKTELVVRDVVTAINKILKK